MEGPLLCLKGIGTDVYIENLVIAFLPQNSDAAKQI